MAIISFDKDTPVDFIPAYGGNRDSENPCVVRLKFVPYAKVQEYSRLLAAKQRNVTEPEKAAELTQAMQRKQFVDSVESVSGFSVGGKEITDPGEIYDRADTEFIVEILRAMESAHRLSEGQRKNS